MRYLPVFSVSLLLMIAIAGCHRRQAHAVAPPQAQAPPIVSTLPPIPPRTLPDVEVAKAKPTAPAPHPAAAPKEPTKKVARKHPHHNVRKPEEEKPEPSADTSSSTGAPAETTPAAVPAAVKTPVLGQLSTDDTAADPDIKKQTHNLIEDTENRLKKLSSAVQAAHKNDIAQIESFLKQAEQAWSTNDVVGAQTLANKAKILMDDLSK
jgi:hypothetical protein